jgi:Zn-dependent protease
MELDLQTLATLPMWLVAFLFSTTCHEAAHALAAKLGGDDTALRGGQVTLDPIPHIKRSPFGMLVVPILTFIINNGQMMGWASAPYDPFWARRHPKRAALMSAAGPAANFTIMLVAAGIIHVGMAMGELSAPSIARYAHVVVTADGRTTIFTMFLSALFSLNLLLGTFNLMPVPPLDGNGVVPLLLSDRAAESWTNFFQDRTMMIGGLFAAMTIFGKIFSPLFLFALHALHPGVYG